MAGHPPSHPLYVQQQQPRIAAPRKRARQTQLLSSSLQTKTTPTTPTTTTPTTPTTPTGVKASDLFVKILIKYGVQQIFGVPGEANPDFMMSLMNLAQGKIDFILTRHEQGAAFNAYGVSKAKMFNANSGGITEAGGGASLGTGLRPSVCLATEGPGATNLITGLACANQDQVPIIAITGQCAQDYKRGFQNIDVCGMMKQIAKSSTSIGDPNDLSEIVVMAFRQALTPPYGVVHIEFPTDVAGQYLTNDESPLIIDLNWQFLAPNPTMVQKAYNLLTSGTYKQPILLVGPAVFVRTAGSPLPWDAVATFAKLTNIGVVVAPGGKGVIDPNSPLYLNTLNFTPYDWTNYALLWADLVITVGYDQAEYSANGWNFRPVPVLHISDIHAEVGWNYEPLIEVIGDIGYAFEALNGLAKNHAWPPAPSMYAYVKAQWKKSLAYKPDTILPECVFQGDLANAIGAYMQHEDGVVILDSGAHQVWALRNAEFNKPENLISSNSMASMGIALPCALGYAMENQRIGDKNKKILVVTGDGGFMMNVQEMATIHQINKVFPHAKIVVMVWNDSALGYVEWAEQQNYGTHFDLTEINPDFAKLGAAFDWTHFAELTHIEQVVPTLKSAFASNKSAIFSVKLDTSQNVRFSNYLYANVTAAVQQNLGITLPEVNLQVGRFS